jgi:hypothetical protein
MVTELPDTSVPSWSIVNLVPVPSAVAVTKSLRLEVALYPTNKYGWTIKGGVFDGSKTIQGSNNADTLNTNTTKTTLHGIANILVKGTCATKHRMHIGDLTNIPITNVLVKSFCVSEHPRHINYLANIPTTNILVKGILMLF